MKVISALKKFKNTTVLQKLNSFLLKEIILTKNIKILEFGVDKGISTAFFLNLCKKNKGKLLSVDIENYEHLYKEKEWTFLNCRDDNFNKINSEIKWPIDIFFIDTEHTANHVEKMIYLYFDKLKKGGIILIDDISWIPYVKYSYRDSEWVENNNKNTFFKILDIYNANQKILNLEFTFMHSGMAKLTKISNKKLNTAKKILSRKYIFKNLIRRLANK
jgi:predicted O-methyltransferase YrrM